MAALALLGFGFAAPSARSPEGASAPRGPLCRPASLALGASTAGRLLGGAPFPSAGASFFTWDPLLHRRPNRPWRRFGTRGVVRAVLHILAEYARAHPRAARVGVGDLSLPRGGPFGPKHASHQNGLDVDVYYPRRDRRERPPKIAAHVDRRLAQELVDRFVAAGATVVFVGPNVGLTGPRGIVETLWNHDNHLHARFPNLRFLGATAGNPRLAGRRHACSPPTALRN